MADANQLLSLTQELIRIPSTADRPEDIARCRDLAADFFANEGLTVERIDNDGIPSLVVTKGTKTPKIFLNGHLDVVPGDDEQFTPRQDGDKLYGRGALDMKSGVAVMMQLMKDLAKTKHDVGLMLVGDEEQGGFKGTGFLLDQGYSCEAAVIPDGGKAINRIVQKAKGILHVALHADGTAAHSSAPWNGDNAINKLTKALQALETVFTAPADHPDDHWKTTCSFGLITGGTAVNQVPASAMAVCDIRFTEDEHPDDILQRIAEALPLGIRLEPRRNEPPMSVDMDHPLVTAFAACVKDIGREPEHGMDHGASDGRFFTSRGIPVIISQPDGDNHHAKNEWVSIPSIGQYYDVLRAYLDRVAQ